MTSLSAKEIRKIDPSLASLSDDELIAVTETLSNLADMAYEQWTKRRFQKSH